MWSTCMQCLWNKLTLRLYKRHSHRKHTYVLEVFTDIVTNNFWLNPEQSDTAGVVSCSKEGLNTSKSQQTRDTSTGNGSWWVTLHESFGVISSCVTPPWWTLSVSELPAPQWWYQTTAKTTIRKTPELSGRWRLVRLLDLSVDNNIWLILCTAVNPDCPLRLG